MFDNAKMTKEKTQEICEEIEWEDLEIEKAYRIDKIVLKKRDMYYATVGQRLEKVLSKHFDKKIHVA